MYEHEQQDTSDEDFFADVHPADGDEGLDWDHAQLIPDEVMQRFADRAYPTRAVGIALRRIHGKGKYAIRHRDDRVYAVPRV